MPKKPKKDLIFKGKKCPIPQHIGALTVKIWLKIQYMPYSEAKKILTSLKVSHILCTKDKGNPTYRNRLDINGLFCIIPGVLIKERKGVF